MKGRAVGEGPAGVDEYLARTPEPYRAALGHLRGVIRGAAPKAEETVSYRMPAFRHHGALVYYAAFRDHLSFFPGSPGVREKFAEELREFAGGKGTFRFTPDRPIPDDLIRRIVRERVRENEARAIARDRPRPGGRRRVGTRPAGGSRGQRTVRRSPSS